MLEQRPERIHISIKSGHIIRRSSTLDELFEESLDLPELCDARFQLAIVERNGRRFLAAI